MSRWWPVGVFLLLLGAGATTFVMWPPVRPNLPAGQTRMTYDPTTRLPKDQGLYALQWLADGVRCPVTDNVSLMASCVLQRYGKMRDKALSARARYDALVGLERAYWANLAREGLTQRVEHVPTGR